MTDALPRRKTSMDERERTCRCGEEFGSTDAIASINIVLGEDRNRAAFVDDAVQIVVNERDQLRETIHRLRRADKGDWRLPTAEAMNALGDLYALADAKNQEASHDR